MSETVNFRGVISKVTPDGASAVVTLNPAVDGRRLAVISTETTGRSTLVNTRGRLESGSKVIGLAKKGPDALRAIKVSLAPTS